MCGESIESTAEYELEKSIYPNSACGYEQKSMFSLSLCFLICKTEILRAATPPLMELV